MPNIFHQAGELYKWRILIQTLVSRELKARYRGTVLGFLWSFVNPLLLMIVYTIVFGSIMKSGDPAFIEVAPGQENAYAAYIVEKLKPRAVIPYDRSGSATAQKELADELGRKYLRLEYSLFRDAGDRWHYIRKIR
jgi:hypothetical protein